MTHKNYFTTGLYSSQYEKDNCGIGFVAHVKGIPSHKNISHALVALKNMSHRGAESGDSPTGDSPTGDGAGILIQIPYEFFNRIIPELHRYPGYGVGMVFMPKKITEQNSIKKKFESIAKNRDLKIISWRRVPTNNEFIGDAAKKTEPEIWQVFIERTHEDNDRFERQLYLLRKIAEKALRKFPSFINSETGEALTQCYFVSLSGHTIIYKGMLLPSQLDLYYPDLQEPDLKSAFALVHSRFSTNTLPAWELAHPYRYLCHNGEINTIRGNINWLQAREGKLSSPHFGDEIDLLFPIASAGNSDSSSLDNAVEFLVQGGRSLPHSLMMMIPEPWDGNPHMSPEKRSFYEYHAALMEPWDGPASICFTDGRYVGAILDRNGLRPCRYTILDDSTVILASETGVVPVAPETVVESGRLQPGRMFLLDIQEGRIISDQEIKAELATIKPYAAWNAEVTLALSEVPEVAAHLPLADLKEITQLQRTFGYTREELTRVLLPMAINAEESTSSMGNDTPLAILSEEPQLVFKYFRQLFAQVTNPPIDPIRERFVMSLATYLGPRPNLLSRELEAEKRIKIDQPILLNADLDKIRALKDECLKSITLAMVYDSRLGKGEFSRALHQLCEDAANAVKSGAKFIILSDRGVDADRAPIPSLLGLSAVHHHLIRNRLRAKVDLIVETGEARDTHQLACLLGYGAGAINPYLVFDTLTTYASKGLLGVEMSGPTACERYIKAANKGLLKVMSKMGISTLQSYCGAQIFEVIGITSELVDRYFNGTASRLGGLDLADLAEEALMRHRGAFNGPAHSHELEPGGEIHFRDQGEMHFWNPTTIAHLQLAAKNNDFTSYQVFSAQVEKDNRRTLRGLLQLRFSDHKIPLDEVEPAASIVKRFTTGAMSFGALGKEAHETLALAMNKIGAKSNSGEGGEDAERFNTQKNSYIKQIASARFGVTTHYLINAKELQIKIAQGAKPGEGGQLPGYKVDEMIARLRHSSPGVQLISPPPHHDIYSIEDLAQLIFDLRNVNPYADISVKLVSEAGVGTVAAGVAKAKANKILISGDSGGTGASPISSIKSTGIPWEIGLAETHQTLLLNGLRQRVRLETDGQLKTGRDVVIAALLGADEYGFSTAPLIVEGCIMMRKCHLNTCPVGIATQDPELRKKFTGQPEHVINYFFFVAEEVRRLMAQLGVRTLGELIGRTDLIKNEAAGEHWKARRLDLSALLKKPLNKSRQSPGASPLSGLYANELHDILDLTLSEKCAPALEKATSVSIDSPICNQNRAVGAFLSHKVVSIYGAKGLAPNTIEINFKGSAGQSFGAFLARGITLRLEGEANDYVGKSLSGGKIIIYPFTTSAASSPGILMGNTCLYGATSGELFLAGSAGERFAVRNSGAAAVVEGVGDHGCEYMTGGVVVVLGATGQNFAAGMSGGTCYVFDDLNQFSSRCNQDMVSIEAVTPQEDISVLYTFIMRHYYLTGSKKAALILADWLKSSTYFKKIIPTEYKQIVTQKNPTRSASFNKGATPWVTVADF